MISTKSVFQEIRANDDAYRLYLSIACQGEAQGGWENEALAERTDDPELAAKIARHGRDESKHARLFGALLRKRGLEPCEVPFELDYTLQLTRAGIGIPHEFLAGDARATADEIIAYLVHGRVTEQRGAEEIDLQRRVFENDPELGRAIRLVADDEVNHLSHCHEELQKLVDHGHGETVHRLLREYALVEIRVYRDVGLAVMERLADYLDWPAWKRGLVRLGIHGTYWVERAWRWRRMVTILPPERPNALGEPAAPVGEPGAATAS